MKTLDACGMSCPEPLLMLKNALETEKEVALLLDDRNAIDNCSYYAKRRGYNVNVSADGGRYTLHIAQAK